MLACCGVLHLLSVLCHSVRLSVGLDHFLQSKSQQCPVHLDIKSSGVKRATPFVKQAGASRPKHQGQGFELCPKANLIVAWLAAKGWWPREGGTTAHWLVKKVRYLKNIAGY